MLSCRKPLPVDPWYVRMHPGAVVCQPVGSIFDMAQLLERAQGWAEGGRADERGAPAVPCRLIERVFTQPLAQLTKP